MNTQTVVVTGSAGFIGFHLAGELLRRGHNVVGIDNFNDYYNTVVKEGRSKILKSFPGFREYRIDLCDDNALEKVFRENEITRVCNLAAQAGVRYSLTNPHAYEKSNVLAFLNILEMVRHFKVPRLVYASSSSVYGGNKKLPFAESDPVNDPLSLYAATKRANELMAHSYTNLYGFQTIGLRFFNAYGPWGRPDAALWLFVENIKSGKKIKVFNHGNMKRDFTFIDDIVKGICSALFAEGLDKTEIINLGNHRSEQLMDMISIIERELGMKAEKEMMPMQVGDVPGSLADIDKARQKLGFEPSTTIEQGIPAFIRWYNEHPEITEIVKNNR